jgi:hypothetical protein
MQCRKATSPELNAPAENFRYSLNAKTGERTELPADANLSGALNAADTWPAPPSPDGLRAITEHLNASSSTLTGVFLETTPSAPNQRLLVAGDAHVVRLIGAPSGHGAGILYLTRGALLFCPIAKTEAPRR